MARERTKEVTIKATIWQVSRWESAARIFGRGGIQRFMALAADVLARRLREISAERAKADPIGQRINEKRRLGTLLAAATAALDYLPKHVESYTYGQLNPKRDLQDAIKSVKYFLEETGEVYGP